MQKNTISSGQRLHLPGYPKSWIFTLLHLLSATNLILTSTYCPGIHIGCLHSIADFYGFEPKPAKLLSSGRRKGLVSNQLPQRRGPFMALQPKLQLPADCEL